MAWSRALEFLLQPHAETPAEIRAAMDQELAAQLRRILPALAAIFLSIAGIRLLLVLAGLSNALNWWTFASGIAILAVWLLQRSNRIAPDRIPLVALAVGILIAIHSLAEFFNQADTIQAGVMMLALAGSASLSLDTRIFDCLSVFSVTGWVVLAPLRLGWAGAISWSVVLIAVTLLGRMGIRDRLSQQLAARQQDLSFEAHQLDQQAKYDRLEHAILAAKDGTWRWDLTSGTFDFSPAWAAMLGYEPKEIDPNVNEWLDRIHPGYRQQVDNDLASVLRGESQQFQNVHRISRKDGTYLWALVRGSLLRDESGAAIAVTGTSADVTFLMEAEERLMADSFHDKLTGLANRDFLVKRLIHRMEAQNERRRDRASNFAVLFLDLDRFKSINDTLGHSAGDQLLREAAGRLQRCTRPSDVVARFGGDEFVILLDRIGDAGEAVGLGTRIRDTMAMPFQIAGGDVMSGASIGVALNNPAIKTAEELLKNADAAMYQAKKNGKGQVRLFRDDMPAYETSRSDLKSDLRRALARGQFVLHYQPCYEIASGKILGVEALLRWQRSESELLLPAEFLPLAEESGLIEEIGEWALRSACAQNAAWQQAGIPPIRMAVNVSARQLRNKDFFRTVARALEETGHEPHLLELELTESAFVSALDQTPQPLEHLRALGVRLAIDDFGTGYSSLNYLRKASVDTLKMDRCFVADVVNNPRSGAVARGLVELAHSLGVPVTAEGVERNSQLSFLAGLRCDYAQGFLAGPAVPPQNLVDLLRTGEVKQAFQRDFDSIVSLNRLGCLFDNKMPAVQHYQDYLVRG